VIDSEGPFGFWLWGWGTPPDSGWVSYGYPGGMTVEKINEVIVPPK
jgi:hypothetical protein